MEGPTYLFFIRNNDTHTFYQVVNDAVMTGGPVPLEYSPSGWQNVALSNERNNTYFALDRSFGVALDFVEDGAKILKHIAMTYGSEVNLSLIIARQDLYFSNTEYGFFHKNFYTGDIDFSTYLHDGPKVTVSLMEGGPVRYIKAYQSTKYEFPLDVPEALKVKHTGTLLFKKANYAVVDGLEIKKSLYGVSLFLPLIHLQDEGLSTGIGFMDQDGESAPNAFADKIASDNVFALGTQDVNAGLIAHVEGKFKFKITKNDGGSSAVSFRILTSESTLVTQDLYRIPSPGGTNKPVGTIIELPFSFNIPILSKTKLHFEAVIGGGTVEYGFEFMEGSNFFLSYANTFKTTFYKVLPPLYLFQQIIKKITDGRYSLKSDLFTEYFNLAVTSGDGVRGLAKSVVKTSLTDAFQSYNIPLNIGMGMIAGALRLEKKGFFVDYNDPIILGPASKPKIKFAAEQFCSTIKYGYPTQNYDAALGATNGRYEFNNTNIYTTPITTKSKEYNGVSVYRADSFGIEFTRINLEGKTTTDNSSDNDVFFIHLKKVGIMDPVEGLCYELNRELNHLVTGVPDPASVFNVWLAPALSLKRSGNYIRSGFYKLDNKKLVYQTTDKNPELKLTYPDGTIHQENASIEISTLDAPLTLPVVIDIDVPSDIDLFEILDQNPVKCFQFSINGIEYKGLPIKCTVEPYTADKQTYSLLSAPANDLTPLIDFYE